VLDISLYLIYNNLYLIDRERNKMKDYKVRQPKEFVVTLPMNIIGQLFIVTVILVSLIGN